jgi:hypothetical protein
MVLSRGRSHAANPSEISMRKTLVIVALPLVVTACKSQHSAATEAHSARPHREEAAPPHETGGGAAAPGHAAAGQVKPPLRGLLSMGAYKFLSDLGEPDNSLDAVRKKPGLLQGIVILATWRSLQKSATSGLTENNEIDRGLAEVQKYNAEHPSAPLAVKLRVWGGYFAPEWVINESGGPIHVVHTNINGAEMHRVLGHVWSDPYRKAWAHLQELLAAKYDASPLIHEVAVTSCMMFTAEPFSIDTTPAALKPLRDAGMTDAAYQACLDGISHDYAPWKTTRFETPLNPFKSTDGAKARHDEAFTLAWMDRCHKAEPVRCVFDSHDLDPESKVNKDVKTLYAAMKKSGAEVEFQSFTKSPEDFDGMMKYALDSGAQSVELWQDSGGFTEMSDATLQKYAKLLEGNGK